MEKEEKFRKPCDNSNDEEEEEEKEEEELQGCVHTFKDPVAQLLEYDQAKVKVGRAVEKDDYREAVRPVIYAPMRVIHRGPESISGSGEVEI